MSVEPEKKPIDQQSLMSAANNKVVVFAGSLLLLTFSFKLMGIDFAPIINAWTMGMEHRIEAKVAFDIDYTKEMDALKREIVSTQDKNRVLEARLRRVEDVAHAPSRPKEVSMLYDYPGHGGEEYAK